MHGETNRTTTHIFSASIGCHHQDHITEVGFAAVVVGERAVIHDLQQEVEGLIVNEIHKLTGIFNGTANYILSEMEIEEKSFDEVLLDAQEKGYAEVDPSFDIDGIDAAHKTIILSGLAYGKMPSINNLSIKGIRNITLNDITYCDELGQKDCERVGELLKEIL